MTTQYSKTVAFKKWAEQESDGLPLELKLRVEELTRTMISNIGEYEHGTVEPSDVFDGLIDHVTNEAALNLYIAVCEDLILTVINS